MKSNLIIGYKMFKMDEDGAVHMIRVIDVKSNSKNDKFSTLKIKEYDTDKIVECFFESDYIREYTPLTPDAVFTISIATVINNGEEYQDVVCTANKYNEFILNTIPYAVCRQSTNDIFAELIDPNKHYYGLAINQDTCPPNIDFRVLMSANSVSDHRIINFYRTDTIEDILDMVPKYVYNAALVNLYTVHAKSCGDPRAIMMNEHDGWCKSIDLLLKLNNFQTDINQMLGITNLEFDMSEYLEEVDKNGNKFNIAREDFRLWLSSIYKMNIKEIVCLKYDHDIDTAEYKDARYLFLRDSTKTLYFCLYTIEGEYLEADLEEKAKELDFSTKFRISFYNKYNNINNDNSINIDIS